MDLDETPYVLADPEQLSSVIRNLLINAREAISLDGKITLSTRSRDGHVEISVEDNGCGMSPEYMEKELFVPFHTTKSNGLGIGLYQSKKIVEAHKGSIKVESHKDKGTIVRISFPEANVAEADLA